MPDFTVIAISATRGSDEAEFEVLTADFASADEGMGYARRMAEEAHRLSAQMNMDLDYSHVAVFAGEVEDQADLEHPDLVGVWLYDEDGVGWSTAAALREGGDDGSEPEAGHA